MQDMCLLFLFQSCGEFAVCTIMHGRCIAQGKESAPRHPYIGMLHHVAHLVVSCILPESLLDMHCARLYAFGRLMTYYCGVLWLVLWTWVSRIHIHWTGWRSWLTLGTWSDNLMKQNIQKSDSMSSITRNSVKRIPCSFRKCNNPSSSSWHPPVCPNYKLTGCTCGNRCHFRHVEAEEEPNKKVEERWCERISCFVEGVFSVGLCDSRFSSEKDYFTERRKVGIKSRRLIHKEHVSKKQNFWKKKGSIARSQP